MLYRFGWKSPKRIEDYTLFLGQRDTSTEDMQIAPDDRLSWEKKLNEQERDTLKVKAELTNLKEQTAKQIKDLQEAWAHQARKLIQPFLDAKGITPTEEEEKQAQGEFITAIGK